MNTVSNQIDTFDPADIVVGQRLRALDLGWVDMLRDIIGEHGQDTPIKVRRLKGKLHLVVGAHRLAACAALSPEKRMVRAEVVECSDLEAELMEIDENLIRYELSPLDKGRSLARRKAVYEKLHPDTKHGAQGGRGGQKNETVNIAFSKITAEKVGLSESSVKLLVRIGDNISDEIRERIVGTPLARNQSELLNLAKHGPSIQTKIVDLVLSEDGPEKVALAFKHIDGHVETISDADKKFKKLLDAWERASPKVQRRFLTHIKAELVKT